jgi:hypothetical protein
MRFLLVLLLTAIGCGADDPAPPPPSPPPATPWEDVRNPVIAFDDLR